MRKCAGTDGSYSMEVPTGSYVVGFATIQYGDPVEFYNGKFSLATADPITVTDGADTAGVDVTFGSVSGTVTEAGTHQQLANICANVFGASDLYRAVGSACTDDTGHYAVGALPTGNYVVQFVDSKGPHVDTWYNGKSSGQDADLVRVNAGADTTNIDTEMAIGAQITGHITDAGTGDPVPNACVYVYDSATNISAGTARCTDDSGAYITGGIPAGDYKLDILPSDGLHAAQWYDGKDTFATADTVHVAAGAPTQVDEALSPGTSITGTITDTATGDPIQNVFVQVTTASGEDINAWAYTDDAGKYSTPGLRPGSYFVYFGPPYGTPYQGQWYNGKPDAASADTVTVTSTGNTTGIDGALSAGGTVSGTVSDAATHQPLANVCVEIHNTDFNNYGYACTDEAGKYTTSGVPSGDYYADFYDYYGPYIRKTYGVSDANPFGTPFSVTAGENASGIDVDMIRGAQFKGTVTDAATGVPLSNICVSAIDEATSDYYSSGLNCSGQDGKYTSAGVPTGSYDLEFDNFSGRYVTQWYLNAPDQVSATALQASVGVDVTGVDAVMVLGGAVSGTVTADGSPLTGICVTLYRSNGDFGGDGGCTDADGNYTSAQVAPGTYKVGFYDPNNAYASEYYNDKPDVASADTVEVVAGDTTGGIDASLAAQSGGDLSGTVRDTLGNEQYGAYVQACNPALLHTGGGCRWTTDQFGFDLSNLPAGDYTVTGFAPAGSDLLPTTVTVTVTDAGTSATLTLHAPTPLPTGTSIKDGDGAIVSTPGTVPALQWQDSYTMELTGCANGTGTLTITAKDAYTGSSNSVPVALTESPKGSGHYTGVVPALYPAYGQATFAWTITCGSTHTSSTATVYIDPSGTVTDQHGNPISGAVVTLLRSDAAAGPYAAVPDGSEQMSPSNRTNPMTSGADGSYGWDVVAGYYKVKAVKDGCTTVTSNVLTIPPAVTGLTLALTCGSSADITPPDEHITSHPANPTASRTAAFGFTGSDDASPPVTFTCSIDGKPASSCTSGVSYTGLADGTHTFALVAHDTAGNTTKPTTYDWRVDATKPTVKLTGSMPAFTLASQVTITWSGSDAGSGIAHYQLHYRRAAYNGGFPSTWTLPSAWKALTSLKVTASLTAGYDYCYQVQAIDRAGNASGWSASQCVARPLDDRSMSATAGWTRGTSSAYYLSTYTSTTRYGAALTKSSVALDRIGVVATKCASCGVIGIYVGTKLIGKVNLASSTTKYKVLILLPKFSLRTGKVTLKVLTTGKKVLIDGLAVSRT